MSSDSMSAGPANMHDQLVQRREKFQAQTQADRQRSRAIQKPAPLSLEETFLEGQPRVGPLPPTPQKSTAQEPYLRKRKEQTVALEDEMLYSLQKKKKIVTLKVKASAIAVARRVGVNDLTITMNDHGAGHKVGKSFLFLELPGEVRNIIYGYCVAMTDQQALLVHLPKTSTLRSSTRMVRTSLGKYREPEDPEKNGRISAPAQALSTKESNRPFVGLTQVCKQIRREYYPMYASSQEVGVDLVHTAQYARTFFNPDQPMVFADREDTTGKNMPFWSNITIAVSDRILPVEKATGYIDALPFLHVWANSCHIEAGFGRYTRRGYIPQADGEAKDLYRLYGRKVLPDRSCGAMNQNWRVILRDRHLAAVRIHRDGGSFGRPFIHLVCKYEHRESWMTGHFSRVPGTLVGRARPGSWLWNYGFDNMEHFSVRVGAETYPGEFSSSA